MSANNCGIKKKKGEIQGQVFLSVIKALIKMQQIVTPHLALR